MNLTQSLEKKAKRIKHWHTMAIAAKDSKKYKLMLQSMGIPISDAAYDDGNDMPDYEPDEGDIVYIKIPRSRRFAVQMVMMWLRKHKEYVRNWKEKFDEEVPDGTKV